MSEPLDPQNPSSSRPSKKGLRPEPPTLDLTATTVETEADAAAESSTGTAQTPDANPPHAPEAAPEPPIGESGSEARTDAPTGSATESSGTATTAPLHTDSPQTAPHRSRSARLVELTAAALLGGGITYALVTFLAPLNQPAPAYDYQTLEKRLAEIEAAVTTLPPPPSEAAVTTLVESKLKNLDEKTASNDAALEETLTSVTQRVDAYGNRLETLESNQTALAQKAESSPQGAVLQSEITKLEERLDTALKESQQQLALNRSGSLILEIERALRYGRPFDSALQQLKQTMPQLDITTLAPFATSGVPRMDHLANQLRNLLADTPYEPSSGIATEPKESLGFWDHFKQSAASLVKISPAVTPAAVNSQNPRARVIALIDAEDWPAVVKEQQKLDNAAYNATREATNALAARLEAEKALASLNTQLYTSPVLSPQPLE